MCDLHLFRHNSAERRPRKYAFERFQSTSIGAMTVRWLHIATQHSRDDFCALVLWNAETRFGRSHQVGTAGCQGKRDQRPEHAQADAGVSYDEQHGSARNDGVRTAVFSNQRRKRKQHISFQQSPVHLQLEYIINDRLCPWLLHD